MFLWSSFTKRKRVRTILNCTFVFYLLCELLFYLRVKYLHRWANKYLTLTGIQSPIRLPIITHDRAQYTFEMAMKYSKYYYHNAHSADTGTREWLKTWFYNCELQDISKQKVVAFLQWCYCMYPPYPPTANPTANTNIKHIYKYEWQARFIEQCITKLEAECKYHFEDDEDEDGFGGEITPFKGAVLHPSFPVLHRPLLLYIVLLVVYALYHYKLTYYYRFQYLYYYGNNENKKRNNSKARVKVWYVLHRDAVEQCIRHNRKIHIMLYLHGIGTHNPLSCEPFWKHIVSSSSAASEESKHMKKERFPVFIFIEQRWASMTLLNYVNVHENIPNANPNSSPLSLPIPLTSEEMVQLMCYLQTRLFSGMFDRRQSPYSRGRHRQRPDAFAMKEHLRWTVIGHSYGSARAGGIYQFIKHSNKHGIGTGTGIDIDIALPRLVLIDPPNVINSHPAPADFAECVPSDWKTYAIQQSGMRELVIACTCNRFYAGVEYSLYCEELAMDTEFLLLRENDNDMHDDKGYGYVAVDPDADVDDNSAARNRRRQHLIVYGDSDAIIASAMLKFAQQEIEGRPMQERPSLQFICFADTNHAEWLFSDDKIQQIIAQL